MNEKIQVTVKASTVVKVVAVGWLTIWTLNLIEDAIGGVIVMQRKHSREREPDAWAEATMNVEETRITEETA